jgi:Protein of unknown function (DUF1583)
MIKQGWDRFSLSVGLLVLGAATSLAQGDGEKKAPPDLKARFHQDLRGPDPNNPLLQMIGAGVVWEPAGARITIPTGAGEKSAGIRSRFKIRGDFEITASYEILKADIPTKGYGVGVGIYAAINPKTNDAVTLSRRTLLKGETRFTSNRMLRGAGKPDKLGYLPSKELSGKLRLKRVGEMISSLVADGDNAEFVLVDKVKFDSADIRYFQIGADGGNSPAGLDVRFFDLTVRAETLLDLDDRPLGEPAANAPALAPDAAAAQQAAAPNHLWLIVVLVLGLGFILLLPLGVGAWLFLRRGAAPSSQPTSDLAEKPATAAVFVPCSACGKKLKVKAEMAGKKVKCTECGKPVIVPGASLL